MLVLPVARPPGGSRPMMPWITAFGTCQVAIRSSAGCERTVPLTSTSTFGTVYDASPRTVVWNGSASRQLRTSFIVGQVRQGRGRVHCARRDRQSSACAIAHASSIDRPVCVPTCSVRPWRRRAFTVKSTPCQYWLRSGPKSVSNVT